MTISDDIYARMRQHQQEVASWPQQNVRRAALQEQLDSLDAPRTDAVPVVLIDPRPGYHGLDLGLILDRQFGTGQNGLPRIELRRFSNTETATRFFGKHSGKTENGILIALDDIDNQMDGTASLVSIGALRPKYPVLRRVEPYVGTAFSDARDLYMNSRPLEGGEPLYVQTDMLDYELLRTIMAKKGLIYRNEDLNGLTGHVGAVLQQVPRPAMALASRVIDIRARLTK